MARLWLGAARKARFLPRRGDLLLVQCSAHSSHLRARCSCHLGQDKAAQDSQQDEQKSH